MDGLAAPSGYNWDQLNSTAWRANSSRARTPGEGMLEERNNAFRERLHEAIKDAARDVLRQMPVTAGTYMYLKTVAAGMPLPIYDGEDDLQIFMPWIHRLMCYFDLHQIVGTGHDHTRTTILYGALSGHAEMWYEHSVRTGTRSIHAFPRTSSRSCSDSRIDLSLPLRSPRLKVALIKSSIQQQ